MDCFQIGRVTEMGAVVSRWKKLYFNPFPSQEELEALAQVVELEVDTLRSMQKLGSFSKPC